MYAYCSLKINWFGEQITVIGPLRNHRSRHTIPELCYPTADPTLPVTSNPITNDLRLPISPLRHDSWNTVFPPVSLNQLHGFRNPSWRTATLEERGRRTGTGEINGFSAPLRSLRFIKQRLPCPWSNPNILAAKHESRLKELLTTTQCLSYSACSQTDSRNRFWHCRTTSTFSLI